MCCSVRKLVCMSSVFELLLLGALLVLLVVVVV